MLRSLRVACCATLIVLCCSPAWCRKWKGHQGGDFEGDFVALRGRSVFISGFEHPFPMSELSRDDQLFVLEADGAAAKPPEERLQVRPEVAWSNTTYMQDGQPMTPPLVVSVQATGNEPASASRFGMVKVDTVVSDRGSLTSLGEFSPGVRDKLVSPLDRNVPYTDVQQPRHGLAVNLLFQPSDRQLQRIARLTGSFKIVTGDPHLVTVESAFGRKDVRVADAVLKKLGLTVVVNPSNDHTGLQGNFGEQVVCRVAVTGDLKLVRSVAITDPAGRPFFPSSSMAGGGDSNVTYFFMFHKPMPAEARIRLIVLQNARETTIPFDFADLSVPPTAKASGPPVAPAGKTR